MNKKFLSILMIGILSLSVLTGCSELSGESESSEGKKVEENTNTNNRFKEETIDKYTTVLIDKETQVQYLKVVRNAGFDGGVAVTPLYQSNGKPFIGTEIKEKRFSTKTIDKYTSIITDKETGIQYLKIVRNAGFDGGVSLTPMINAEGGLLVDKNK